VIESLLAVVFWASALGICWSYLGYPLLMLGLARWRPRPHHTADDTPGVSFIIPAYNEEACIARKLENTLALEYPPACREILVVADGSGDRTAEIARGFAGRGVALLYQPERRGKPAAMQWAAAQAGGEILVFSDANAMLEPGGLRLLVRHFADPQVACAGGEKQVSGGSVQGRGESFYWRYEARVKRAESLASSAMGLVGELFAIRRALYRPVGEDVLVDDFLITMRQVLEGRRVVYEPRAVAREEASPSLAAEYQRRARIAAGGFQALGRLWGLLSPRRGLVAFQFFSHKVLRWCTPLLMALALAAAAALARAPLYRFFFWAQVVFYLAALAGWAAVRLGRSPRLLQAVFYFCFSNAAILAGLVRYLRGTQSVLWVKVR
jgi:biofilm PGA synthesis N-glycosyltransferase PgaC